MEYNFAHLSEDDQKEVIKAVELYKSSFLAMFDLEHDIDAAKKEALSEVRRVFPGLILQHKPSDRSEFEKVFWGQLVGWIGRFASDRGFKPRRKREGKRNLRRKETDVKKITIVQIVRELIEKNGFVPNQDNYEFYLKNFGRIISNDQIGDALRQIKSETNGDVIIEKRPDGWAVTVKMPVKQPAEIRTVKLHKLTRVVPMDGGTVFLEFDDGLQVFVDGREYLQTLINVQKALLESVTKISEISPVIMAVVSMINDLTQYVNLPKSDNLN